MTSRLKKKKSVSSLDTKYVENFLKNIESKLYDFNRNFLLPYKEKLNKKDKTVISGIAKDFKSPTLVIKNALDELWNHHWMLGQKDVISSESKRKSKYNNSNDLITFATPTEILNDSLVEKRILDELNRRVIRVQKDLKRTTDQSTKNQLAGTLQSISEELEDYLGVLRGSNANTRGKQFASIAVRARDLQETVRVMSLQLSEPNASSTGVDILNSNEFGTIYQDKRTLLLADSLNEDYKKNVIGKIQNYFTNSNRIRPNTREQTLFDSLTTRQDTATQRKYQGILKDSDKLSNQDRLAKKAIDNFVSTITNGKALNDKQLKSFATRDKAEVEKTIREMQSVTDKSPLYKSLSKQLASQVNAYTQDPNTKNYSENIKPLLQDIRDRQINNTLVNGTYKPGAYDPETNEYKPLEYIENAASNIFGLRRIKRIAETEISLAYNLGRLKKLEELGYTKVRITNETENRINRDISLAKLGSLAKIYRQPDSEQYLPLLCDHCLNRNGEVLDIKSIYGGAGVKVDTRFTNRFSPVPPFHVSCWCYFVGVDENKDQESSLLSELAEGIKNNVVANSLANQQTTSTAFYNDPLIQKLVVGGIGLLGVGAAYYAYQKLARNRVQIPISIRPKVNLAEPISELVEREQQETLEDFVNNVDISAMADVAKIAIKLPKAFNVADDVLGAVDTQLTSEVFNLSDNTQSTVNSLISNNPEYLSVLNNLLSSKSNYEAIRNRIINNNLKGADLDEVYEQYLASKSDYESQLRNYMQATKTKRSSLSDVNANLNISARELLLSNMDNLPEGASLESALDTLKSRRLLDSSNNQLRNIERNLNRELAHIDNYQTKESKLIDRALQGKDTRIRAEQLRAIANKPLSVTQATKTLDSVVDSVNKIKRDLNDTRLNIDTIRSISKARLDTSSLVDRAALIDTQKTYMRQILDEKEKVIGQLNKFDNVDKLENFSKLYRSEIVSKAKGNYKYSQGLYSKKEITKLDSTYREISNVLTIKKSYESYLSELDEMLDKMNNFERTIDSNIQFSFGYEVNNINLNKIKMIPRINNLKL